MTTNRAYYSQTLAERMKGSASVVMQKDYVGYKKKWQAKKVVSMIVIVNNYRMLRGKKDQFSNKRELKYSNMNMEE